MNKQKITYFFREPEKFFNFVKKYSALKTLQIKNEDFSWVNFIPGIKNFDHHDSRVLILTSENALIALKKILKPDEINQKQFILVGKNLQDKLLSELGEETRGRILFCGNSVVDIKKFLELFFDASNDQGVIYLRGEIVKHDLKSDFNQIEEIIVYRALYKKDLSDEFLFDLRSGLIKNFVFFSKESFENFMRISSSSGVYEIQDLFKEINLFCLGDFGAEEKMFKKVFIAKDNMAENLVSLILKQEKIFGS